MNTGETADRPILIAGGGIGGLMAALTLARSGFNAHVLERAEAFGEVGAGLQLGPNATRILTKWGLQGHLEADLVAPQAVRIMDGVDGEPVAEMPLGDQFTKRFGSPYQVIHRADLHRALLEACGREASVVLETGVSAIRFEQDADGVTIFTSEGRAVPGHALIGADGIRSAVRQQLLGDGEPDYANHTAYRATLPRDAMPADCAWDAAALWTAPGCHLVHYPIRGGRDFNMVAISTSTWRGTGWSETASSAEVLAEFGKVCPQIEGLLSAPGEIRKWALADRPPADNWTAGRVTLLGDAAHPVLPYLAQGAAMAIEDTDRLATCLKDAGGEPEAAFKRYEALRQPRTARLRKASRVQGGVYHAGGIKRLIRNQIMKRLSAEQWYNRVAWIYDSE